MYLLLNLLTEINNQQSLIAFKRPINVHIFVSLLVISVRLKCGYAGLKAHLPPFHIDFHSCSTQVQREHRFYLE